MVQILKLILFILCVQFLSSLLKSNLYMLKSICPGIPLCGIAPGSAELRTTVLVLRGIVRNFVELWKP